MRIGAEFPRLWMLTSDRRLVSASSGTTATPGAGRDEALNHVEVVAAKGDARLAGAGSPPGSR